MTLYVSADLEKIELIIINGRRGWIIRSPHVWNILNNHGGIDLEVYNTNGYPEGSREDGEG